MNLALLLVLAVGVAYRATRLVTTDSLFERQRHALFLRYPPDRRWAMTSVEQTRHGLLYLLGSEPTRRYPRKLGQLFDCPWCVGFWLSGITWGLTWHFHPLVLPGLWWPAISVGVGVLAAIVER